MEQEDGTNKHHPSGAAAAAATPAALVEKEHMFDKVVTPSDVGKLNRLVIPKQHAERFFPLDAASGEKGLLLSFEDRNGKPWPFRYSYWNSSQSYVMTKGWSRFVKEKRLDAGDTISFGRGIGDSGRHRLFIDWRRRPAQLPTLLGPPRLPLPSGHRHQLVSFTRSPPPASTFYLPSLSHTYHHNAAAGGSDGRFFYFPPLPPQAAVQPVLDSVPVMYHKGATAKRVRLFGVNLDCPEPEADPLFTPSLQLQLGGVSSSSSSSEQHLSLDLDM